MNLLDGPPPTLLPPDPDPQAALESGQMPAAVAARYPASSLAWAALADLAWSENRVIESYAFARVGYHRGLDQLRASGWRGSGYVRWQHESNRGFLECLEGLAVNAGIIGEESEAVRCQQFLIQCDPRGRG